MKKWKRWQKWLLIAAGSGLIGIFLADILTQLSTKDRVYTATAAIPHRKVGLLLGTSKRIADGRRNLFYFYRLEAAVELFKAGKIDVILASGDNSTKYYDEPSDMKADLVKKGIPANRIYLDYAGFRTLDSVVRSKVVFGQTAITVISQQFHNERAIFIAQQKGIDAVAYNAKGIGGDAGLKVRLRESLARVKMLLDLIFGKRPKFYGPSVEIE